MDEEDSDDEEWHGISCEDVEEGEYEPWYGINAIALEFEDDDDVDVEEWHGIDVIALEFEEEWHGVNRDEEVDLLGVDDIPDYATLINSITEEDEKEFNQEVIDVPKHTDPFQDERLHIAFQHSLARLQRTGFIPIRYGAHPNEWDAAGYPSFGLIRTGLSGRKELRIALPDLIWRPRSVQWVQGLYLMNQLLATQDK